NNHYGQRIFTAHSIFEPRRWDREHAGPQVLSCEIPSVTLMPGEYSVKVWLDLRGKEADAIEDAVKIKVVEADFYGSGRAPWQGPRSPGLVVLPHRWYLEAESPAPVNHYLEIGNPQCHPQTR